MRDSRSVRHLVLGLVLAASTTASAQSLTRGPFVQNPDALTTTMTILWWTDVAGDSTVEYGTTVGLGSSVTVPQAASCEIGAAGTCHTVQLTGLAPGTKYFYQLVTNGVTVLAGSSSIYFHTFRTPTDPAALHFTVVGDWGSGSSATTNVANNQNAADPPLIVTTGDNAYENGTLSDWDNNAIVAAYENTILRRAVFMPILGNHDVNDVGASNWANSVEIKMFALPQNAPAGQEERFFSFDQGDAHFVMLDSNGPAINATQTNWLAADLATTTRTWVFVFLHHTPYSCATGLASLGSSSTVRSTWGPLFEEHGVDVVFDGHDHSWERSVAVDDFSVGGGAGPDGETTIYIMTGGGGKTLDGDANVDDGGPYGQGFFRREYCYWLADGCPGGPTNPSPPPTLGPYCSFSRFHHTDVRIVGNDTLTIRAIDQNNVQFDQLTIVKDSVCGNGTVEGAEECDDTNPCCDSVTCQWKASGTTCRSTAGTCDMAETCTGSSSACPANGFLASGTTCRVSAGVCDAIEICTGSAAACPADAFLPSSTVCRAAPGLCDQAETCTGSSAACPADGVKASGTLCRAAAGVCDAVESCNGVSAACPADGKVAGGTVCNAAAGDCDVAETCDGSTNACPADGFVGAGTPCRASAGICDVAETCTGGSAACPADGFVGTGTPCRGSAGICDVAESCTGGSATCPTDGFAPSSTVCRASSDLCDQAESCTGSAAACPTNSLAPSNTVCRPPASACDQAETCSGSTPACPADGFAASGTVCRAVAGTCDQPESCSGSSASCPANAFLPSTTLCRTSVGICDLAESCTGTAAACPVDGFIGTSTVCRAIAGACDVAETCTGSSTACPADQLASAGVECRAPMEACDVAELCTGANAECPADTGQPDGDGDGVCDADDACPTVVDPGQIDQDGDGTGDACDPCNNVLPVFATKAKITIQKLVTPPGDDRFKFTGYIEVPDTPSIDPANKGVRVLVHDALGGLVLDVAVPPGSYDPVARVGWRVNGSGTAFTYKDGGTPGPLVGGIYKVLVKKSTKIVGQIKFSVGGKTGAYLVNPANLPLTGTFVIDAPYATGNQCGEAIFPGPLSACTYTAKAGTVNCR